MDRLSSAGDNLISTARLKVHLHLFACELAIMRNSAPEATHHLLAAVATSRRLVSGSNEGDAIWHEFKDRLVLDLGLIHVVKEEDDEAERCLEAVIVSASRDKNSTKGTSRAKGSTKSESSGAMTLPLAEVSLLVLKLSQGHSVPLSSSSTASSPVMSRSASHPSSLSSAARRQSAIDPTSERLQTLTRSLLASEEDAGSSSSPALEFIVSLAKALTGGEITKSKSNLSSALNVTTKLSANHARALTLALLANLFEQTRNTEVSLPL